MEGAAGWLVVHGLGKIGWFRNHVFNPTTCRFLHVGNVYARPGHEDRIYTLIEDALAKYRVPFAVGYFDPRSPVYRRFKAAGSFGLLNTVMETPVRVMAWSRGLSDKDLGDIKNGPLFISPLDIS